MINLKDMDIPELSGFFQEIDEQKFRAKQVFSWLYKGAESFDEMTELSKPLREKLTRMQADREITLGDLEILKVQESKCDGTKKYLFGLADGNTIESVFMKYKYGNSLCVSSQAGCKMGCLFCASAIGGFKRNLSPGELVAQLVCAERETGEKINHIVVMGTGEPFDNYDNVTKFIRLINDPEGVNIGMRNITVSTCGLVPYIEKFGNDFPQVNLAISLHAPNDQIRGSIMPVNSTYPMTVLIDACREYTKATGRRITFEYALVKGKNDNLNQAVELAHRLKGMLCHINLIPLNKVEETGFDRSSRERAEKFKEHLEYLGIPATIRRELGTDIAAACGQLRLGEAKLKIDI